ncbi:unnamed protein product [Malus baccata var. baccata]
MDKSWLTIAQNLEAYKAGINLFLDQVVANGVGPDKFRCPCKRSCNRYTFVRNTVIEHLILYDMDKDYKNAWWQHHGEKNIGKQNVAIGEEETGDEVAGMHDNLNDVFVQPLIEEGVGPSTEPLIGERRPKEVETFFRLLEEAYQDLWLRCKEFKKLEAVVRLYQIKLGLASDGFNPFGKMRHDHSTWHVVLSVYNLPPWICMKQPNLLLSLLIPGLRSPGKEIDVYMRPLIDELNELLQVGTLTYDAYSNQSFTKKAAVLWTISDFPAYGMLLGWSTYGYKVYPHCMHDKESIYLPAIRKICYIRHRCFLEDNHRFRRQTINFNGRREHCSAPRQWTGLQCLEELSNPRAKALPRGQRS